MKKLLITGFDPFGGGTINPSWEAVRQLPDQIGDVLLCKLEIPTIFEKAAETVLAAAQEFNPDAILCVGQAGGRATVTPERIAVNICDAKIADNAGNQPSGQRVIDDGPAAYFATLNPELMADAIRNAGIDAVVSNSAGAFVCNDTLYRLLHHYADTPVRVGFVHIPYLPEQGTPSLPLCDAIAAMTAAIQAI